VIDDVSCLRVAVRALRRLEHDPAPIRGDQAVEAEQLLIEAKQLLAGIEHRIWPFESPEEV
jgi:hypothetical protein